MNLKIYLVIMTFFERSFGCGNSPVLQNVRLNREEITNSIITQTKCRCFEVLKLRSDAKAVTASKARDGYICDISTSAEMSGEVQPIYPSIYSSTSYRSCVFLHSEIFNFIIRPFRGAEQFLEFEVNAPKEAFIALLSDRLFSGKWIQMIIGGGSNTKDHIRECIGKRNYDAQSDSAQILKETFTNTESLSPGTMKRQWINFTNSQVQLGSGDETVPHLTHQIEFIPDRLTHYAYTTKGDEGWFKFHDCDI